MNIDEVAAKLTEMMKVDNIEVVHDSAPEAFDKVVFVDKTNKWVAEWDFGKEENITESEMYEAQDWFIDAWPYDNWSYLQRKPVRS